VEDLEARVKNAERVLRKYRSLEIRLLKIIRKYDELEELLKSRRSLGGG